MKPEFYTPQVLKAYHTSSKRLSTGSGRRPLKYQHRTPRASATEIAHWSRGKTRRKASGKTVKRKGTNQRKRRKVVTTSKEPSILSAKRDPKKTLSPPWIRSGRLYFQVPSFCSNRTNIRLSPFSSTRFSYELLSKASSLFSMNS